MYNTRLTQEEKAALTLRGLYESCGYSFYRMSRFEEYDFYAGRKDFLTSREILTFTDTNGKLMALRPDVTLSIIKHAGAGKYYYDEKVYRVPKNAASFREIPQAGVEITGHLNPEDIAEVLSLAVQSLHAVSRGRKCVLDVADAGRVSRLVPENNRESILRCLEAKNIHGLMEIGAGEELLSLASVDGSSWHEVPGLSAISGRLDCYRDEIRADYSCVGNLRYYTGIVFKGYIDGIPEAVLSGGQYDGMMNVMGRKAEQGIGFAVYLDVVAGGSCDD